MGWQEMDLNDLDLREPVIPSGESATQEATVEELGDWLQDRFGLPVTEWQQIAGGNRCRSWLVTLGPAPGKVVYLRYQPPRAPSAEPYSVWREAQVYRAIADTGVPAPRLLAVHPRHQAIVTTAAEGRADFRRLQDPGEKTAIAIDFVQGLARLHAHPLASLPTGQLGAPETIAACLQAESDIWQRMYLETGRRDPLIELAFDWLDRNIPMSDEPPVLVHGDAGPGNFLFRNRKMTALVDWELAHPGDPLEDLAWFCMRAVMEPVPDFPICLAAYETASGRRIDRTRLLYHRVMVTLRVVIIRHRNVTGLPGNSIVSRALNRRLLVEALAAAEGLTLPEIAPLAGEETPRSPLFDGIATELKSLADHSDPALRDFAKNSAKVLKYLREYDRLGRALEQRSQALLEWLNGAADPTPEAAMERLAAEITAGRIDFARALQGFAALVADDAQLAAPSSGGMARRGFPPLD